MIMGWAKRGVFRVDEERLRELSLPINNKSFRVRTEEAWTAFRTGEAELRALMDQKDRAAVSQQLVDRCTALLAPAFSSPAFELGFNGTKYELILSPEGDRTRLFQLAYFQKHAPRELLDRWNILVGRPRSGHYVLRMFGQDVALTDVQVWAEQNEAGGMDLALYCEKLLKQPKEESHYILYTLLDQALGELAAMRYVDHLDILDEPRQESPILLDQLADFAAHRIDPENWDHSQNPEAACERYTAYRGNPSEEDDWPLRQDIFAGVSCCVPLINAYFQGDDYYMDRLHQDGIVPGFFYYPLDEVDREGILDLRDQLEQAIEARCGEGIVTFTGGATGTSFGYLDFIAWDLKVVLDAAVEVFAGAPVAWAAFHTFRFNVSGIGLK